MRRISTTLLLALPLAAIASWDPAPALAQGPKTNATTSRNRVLTPIQTIKIPSEVAGNFAVPVDCDADGNLYLRTDAEGTPGIRKLSTKGQRLAVFQADSATPNLKVDYAASFSVAGNGDLYQIVFAHEISRYVFIFRQDGKFKASVKLQPGFPWSPKQVVSFPSGKLLLTGLQYDRDPGAAKWPFTGIFSPDGQLLKEITLEDDQHIHDMAAAGDRRVVPVQAPGDNRAIGRGQMELGPDGNAYLMRWLSPAFFYVISETGKVVREFAVDPGDPDYMPVAMHVSGRSIAVLFFQSQTRQKLVKVVDLDGREQATFGEGTDDGKPTLGLAFACFTQKPDRFTFLTETEDNRLALQIAEPR